MKQLPKSVFDDFPNMKDFRVQENMLEGFNYTFEGFRNNLHDLNIQVLMFITHTHLISPIASTRCSLILKLFVSIFGTIGFRTSQKSE